MKRLVASGLAILAAVLMAVAALLDPSAAGRSTTGGRPDGRAEAPRPAERPPAGSAVDATGPSSLVSLGDAELDRQVRRVVESMDATGQPPKGVAQGGRRRGPRGLFENAEGRLPRRPRGFYTETDVWPRQRGGRGAERLVFGRDGSVHYTADHYRTFVPVREGRP